MVVFSTNSPAVVSTDGELARSVDPEIVVNGNRAHPPFRSLPLSPQFRVGKKRVFSKRLEAEAGGAHHTAKKKKKAYSAVSCASRAYRTRRLLLRKKHTNNHKGEYVSRLLEWLAPSVNHKLRCLWG